MLNFLNLGSSSVQIYNLAPWDSDNSKSKYLYMISTICVVVFRMSFILSDMTIFSSVPCMEIVSLCVVWTYVILGTDLGHKMFTHKSNKPDWERSGEKAWLSVIIRMQLVWSSWSMMFPLGTFPWLSLSVILAKTSLKGSILIILSTYQGQPHNLRSTCGWLCVHLYSKHDKELQLWWHVRQSRGESQDQECRASFPFSLGYWLKGPARMSR